MCNFRVLANHITTRWQAPKFIKRFIGCKVILGTCHNLTVWWLLCLGSFWWVMGKFDRKTWESVKQYEAKCNIMSLDTAIQLREQQVSVWITHTLSLSHFIQAEAKPNPKFLLANPLGDVQHFVAHIPMSLHKGYTTWNPLWIETAVEGRPCPLNLQTAFPPEDGACPLPRWKVNWEIFPSI